MDLFTYLLKKKGHNSSVNGDLFSYLLASRKRGTYQTYTGTQINVNDSINARMKNWILGGNSNQNGTPTPEAPIDIHNVIGENNVIENSGKNLYEPIANEVSTNGLTPKVENDGSLSVSGTATNVWSNVCAYADIYLQAGTYTFSISKTYTYSCGVRCYTNKEKTTYQDVRINAGQTKNAKTFTSNIYGWRFYIEGFAIGDEINDNFKIQIEVGSIATPFEKYEGKNYKVSLASKNLFKPYSTGEINVNGVILSIDNKYNIKLNGKATTRSYIEIGYKYGSGTNPQNTPIIPLDNKTIAISTNYLKGKLNGEPYITTQYTSNLMQNTEITEEIKSNVVNNSTGIYRLYIVIPRDCEFTNYEFGIQIEDNNVNTPYVPYLNIELCKIGDYQDKIYKSNDKWYLEKNTNSIIFDGVNNSFSAYLAYDNFDRLRSDLPNRIISGYYTNQNSDYMLCNYFKNVGQPADPTANIILAWNNDGPETFCYFEKNMFSNLQQANQWLTTHNMKVIYAIKTPVISVITDDNLINQLEELAKARSFDEQTNITQLSEQLPFDLTVDIKSL